MKLSFNNINSIIKIGDRVRYNDHWVSVGISTFSCNEKTLKVISIDKYDGITRLWLENGRWVSADDVELVKI